MVWWPKQFRQTHLGSSQEGQLAIIDLKPTKAVVSFALSILRLPDELLQHICDFCYFLRADSKPRRCLGHPSLMAVTLTCQRLYRIAQCSLYREIRLDIVPTRLRTMKFERSLMASQTIGGHCRSLRLQFNLPIITAHWLQSRRSLINWNVTENIICSFPLVRRVHIEGIPAWHSAAPFFSIVSQFMPRLHHLRISNVQDVILTIIWEEINSTAIRSVTLHSIDESLGERYLPIGKVCVIIMGAFFFRNPSIHLSHRCYLRNI